MVTARGRIRLQAFKKQQRQDHRFLRKLAQKAAVAREAKRVRKANARSARRARKAARAKNLGRFRSVPAPVPVAPSADLALCRLSGAEGCDEASCNDASCNICAEYMVQPLDPNGLAIDNAFMAKVDEMIADQDTPPTTTTTPSTQPATTTTTTTTPTTNTNAASAVSGASILEPSPHDAFIMNYGK